MSFWSFKTMKQRRKKKKRVRTRDWSTEHEFAFSHERKKHQKTTSDIRVEHADEQFADDIEPNGVVLTQTGKWAFVQYRGEEVRCHVDERFYEGGVSVLATGDEVLVEDDGGDYMVRMAAPRRSKLSRLGFRSEQIIAANIDLLVIVMAAAQPRFKVGVVDRYLIVAETGGVEPVLCVNKMDLVDREPKACAGYRELGLPVFPMSCEMNEGIEPLREYMKGKRCLLAGQSGVGKSSLLNRLDPTLDLETQEVSAATEKGRHTTTASRLYEIEGGIQVVDTAGIRKLSLYNVTAEEVALYFPEFAELSDQCKFRNCTHTHEPGCAVVEQVEAGEISKLRYNSYKRIRESLEDQAPKY